MTRKALATAARARGRALPQVSLNATCSHASAWAIMMSAALSNSSYWAYSVASSRQCACSSHTRMSLGVLMRVENSFRCSASLSTLWRAYMMPSSVKMPMCARSSPTPASSSAITSSKWPFSL